MTYEELSQVFREEKKGKALMAVRPDLYMAMADLLTRMRQDYEKAIAKDPDSIMAEGVAQNRKQAETMVKQILNFRAKKICNKAVLSADGNIEELSALTMEERDYYDMVVSRSKNLLSTVDRYRGKKTVNSLIDEPMHTPAPEIPVKEPEPLPDPSDAIASGVEDEFPPIPEEQEMFDEEPMDEEPFEEPVIAEQPKPVETAVPDSDTMVLRVLEDLPPFSGPDRDYNLHKEDIVTLPTPMALLLIKTQKAVAVTPSL